MDANRDAAERYGKIERQMDGLKKERDGLSVHCKLLALLKS